MVRLKMQDGKCQAKSEKCGKFRTIISVVKMQKKLTSVNQ